MKVGTVTVYSAASSKHDRHDSTSRYLVGTLGRIAFALKQGRGCRPATGLEASRRVGTDLTFVGIICDPGPVWVYTISLVMYKIS